MMARGADGAAAPARIDLSVRMQPVADQGPRGTCLAFAVTSAHELARTEGDSRGLSVECLYWAAKQRDGDTSEGTSFASAEEALAKTGQPWEELWPYGPLRDASAPDYAPPPSTLLPGNCHRAVLREITPTLEAVRSELAVGRAVAVGIRLWDGFYAPKGGELDLPSHSELTAALHVVTVIGYEDHADRVRLRNSWGEGSGNLGYARVACRFISDYVLEAWTIDRLLY